MPNYFSNSPRTSHTISQNRTVKNVPSTRDRKPAGNKPAPLTGQHGRCASCGGRGR